MAVRQALGYTLRTRPLGEADLIVELFTLERGRVRAVARSARRIRSRFGSAFEPFTLSRVLYFQRDKDDLGRISSCDIERSYFEGLASIERAVVAAYCAELILGFTPEHDPSPTLFRLIGACMDALVTGSAPELVARYMEVWTLRLSGFLPDVAHCGGCGRALGRESWVSDVSLELLHARECSGQRGRRRLAPQAMELLRRILQFPPGEVEAPGAGAVRGLGAATAILISGHLDRAPRSLRVLSELARYEI